jgi:hypothetical protein
MWDIPDKLYDLLLGMEKQKMLDLMLTALENMQAYNGRSLTDAIVMSIPDAREVEKEDGRMVWVTPGDFWKESAE